MVAGVAVGSHTGDILYATESMLPLLKGINMAEAFGGCFSLQGICNILFLNAIDFENAI